MLLSINNSYTGERVVSENSGHNCNLLGVSCQMDVFVVLRQFYSPSRFDPWPFCGQYDLNFFFTISMFHFCSLLLR